MNKRHRLTGLLLAVCLSTGAVSGTGALSAAAAGTQNYAEALQKSLYFYECQQAGPLPSWNRVEWRADSTLSDEVTGGWYDAGDHVKFNLPMAYSASMLAWGLYQYPDGVERSGQMETYVNNLTFVLDYLAACDEGDTVVYQVGSGQMDHTWWGPVELLEYGMKDNGADYDKARAVLRGTDSAVCGEMAAALAAGYCALKDKSANADSYLSHAENIFALADKTRSDDAYNDSDAGGFYRSSHFYDELFYAANWLYIATGEKSYLDKAASYIPNLGKELGSDELKYSWGMCWDDVMQGGLLLYAINTGDSFYTSRVKKHLDYWTDSVKELDGGLRWLTTWGCLRYANTAGFLASVACDTVLKGTDTKKYQEFYQEQIDYSLGDNPDHQSFVVGYGENSPKNPHHRTAHASWKNALDTPETNRHILYGALVGGPNEDGTYTDDRQNYINNEVACDYNAGFTALLCKMNTVSDSKPDPNFPEPEQRDQEFYVETKLKSSDSGVTLSFKFTNHSAWPARIEDNMSYRYYMDLSEVISAGYQPSDVAVRVDRDQAKMYDDCKPAEISPITQYQGNIYYIEVTYPDGRAAMPISEGQHQCELLLALVFPDYQSGWDASNDYSNADLLKNAGEYVISDRIPLYQNGVLYSGVEPDGTKPSTTTAVTTKPAPSTTTTATGSLGDVNTDGSVKLNDLVLLGRYLLGNAELSRQGAANADLNQDGKVNGMDHAALRQMLAQG